jgi:hypothetical protein
VGELKGHFLLVFVISARLTAIQNKQDSRGPPQAAESLVGTEKQGRHGDAYLGESRAMDRRGAVDLRRVYWRPSTRFFGAGLVV